MIDSIARSLIVSAWLSVLDRPVWLVAGFVVGYLGLGLGIAAAFGRRA